MNIVIDGKSCVCEKGEFLLDVARRNKIAIPTLCHHEALRGQGACRVCIVEVLERGRKRIVASCVFPVEGEIEVFTKSETVRAQRGMTLALLRKRAPDSTRIASLCSLYGALDLERLPAAASGTCVLCGLCVRACKELGTGAIATVNRGVTKEIATPYHAPSPDCVGCRACANVCPTGAIEVAQDNQSRTIWGKNFTLARCTECGKVMGTSEELEYAWRKAGLDAASTTVCDECRRNHLARSMAHTYGI